MCPQLESKTHCKLGIRLFLNFNNFVKMMFQDVLILSQFLRSDGCMLPRAITGLCKRQQKIVVDLVAMAQKAG